MEIRPATPEDFDAVAELSRRVEVALLGSKEASVPEVRESLDGLRDWQRDTRLVLDDGRLTGLGLRWAADTWLLVDPDADPAPILAELLPWFAAGSPRHVDVLSTDSRVRDVVEAAGWRHTRSSVDLIRHDVADFVVPAAEWPDGVTLRPFSRDDAPAIYRTIYTDAGWTEVPGHPPRSYEEWRGLFMTDKTRAELQVLAARDERLVGVATGRIFDDGTGWIAQLAVVRNERGNGLGRALLHEALRRRLDAGATALGLSVLAANRAALQMYLAAGLSIDREWLHYDPPQ